ncbi:MAG: hypothetical protein JNK56_30465 [Myxococcales bacterium]|nr:hypothetical protein [Myxococcales bacterium]
MSRRSPLAPLTLLVALVSVACQPGAETKKTDPKKVEAKTETPPPPDEKRDPGTSLDKAVTAIDLAGPVPPETSAVFFAEDGALLPIACYLHDKKKLAGGKDCLKLVKAGDEVYLKSRSAENLDKVGGPKDTLCQSEGLSTPIVDGGAAFDYAVFPKSLARSVVMLPEDSWSEKKPALAAEEIAALTALAKVTGDLTIRQVALQDIDADGTPDKLVSVFQINPKDSERYTFAGVFVQRGSAPGTWIPVQTSSNDTQTYTVYGAVDLDGDRNHELWLNAVTTDGSGGDRLYQLSKDAATGVGKWTCGL